MKVQEKMKTYGSNTLTDSELISLIIGKRVKDRTAVEVADKVMESLPRQNLYYLGETCVQDLEAIYGVGEKSALALCAAIELGKRIRKSAVKLNAPDFSSPQNVASYLMEDMRFLSQEEFRAVYLTTKNQLIAVQTISRGSINASIAKGRDVLKYALRYNAAAIILAHNHPSGNPEPSHEDIAVTQRIADEGQIMEILVLDHIIIGDGTYVSLCERGYI